ncbi:hypothetical protein J6590_030375 [Homalodisca vitripennis]|nr:hypothetical protein J6590_030375 [Homalodisca vitripennis]
MLAELGLTCQIKIVVIERFDGRRYKMSSVNKNLDLGNQKNYIQCLKFTFRNEVTSRSVNIRGKKNKSTTASSKENAILRGAGKLTAASLLGRDNNFLSLGDSAGYTCKS